MTPKIRGVDAHPGQKTSSCRRSLLPGPVMNASIKSLQNGVSEDPQSRINVMNPCKWVKLVNGTVRYYFNLLQVSLARLVENPKLNMAIFARKLQRITLGRYLELETQNATLRTSHLGPGTDDAPLGGVSNGEKQRGSPENRGIIDIPLGRDHRLS